MAMVEGLVVQTDTAEMVILTRDGEFLRVPLLANSVRPGQQVSVDVPESGGRQESDREHELEGKHEWESKHQSERKRQSDRKKESDPNRRRLTGLVAAVLLLIAFGLAAPQWNPLQPREAVAAIRFDIGPAFELYTDTDGRVTGAQGMNSAGEVVLSSLSLRGMAVEDAIDAVTAKAAAERLVVAGEPLEPQVAWVPVARDHQAFHPPISQERLQKRLDHALRTVTGDDQTSRSGSGSSTKEGNPPDSDKPDGNQRDGEDRVAKEKRIDGGKPVKEKTTGTETGGNVEEKEPGQGKVLKENGNNQNGNSFNRENQDKGKRN
ncbi:hypothetical protein GTO91_16365 [Heliobacterium undosum]|uniref:RsgI N-terminal anti-sigma domain-containing protein n=1 Tax=Heliomicrobium undosum TaxID=121734 RepID=A0A845L3S6_9FIRM|nr:anti-sigma factor domain-containing protein [Heliomicrobium undosum]MZP31282.1 hypothetical protein [Heliomicrobium undosum]